MFRCFVIFAYVLLVVVTKYCYGITYTDQWAVQVEGGETVARQLAEKHGFTFITQVCKHCLCYFDVHPMARCCGMSVMESFPLKRESEYS